MLRLNTLPWTACSSYSSISRPSPHNAQAFIPWPRSNRDDTHSASSDRALPLTHGRLMIYYSLFYLLLFCCYLFFIPFFRCFSSMLYYWLMPNLMLSYFLYFTVLRSCTDPFIFIYLCDAHWIAPVYEMGFINKLALPCLSRLYISCH